MVAKDTFERGQRVYIKRLTKQPVRYGLLKEIRVRVTVKGKGSGGAWWVQEGKGKSYKVSEKQLREWNPQLKG